MSDLIKYYGREGRRTEGGKYEIRHFFKVGSKEIFHHNKAAGQKLAEEYLASIQEV